MTSREGMVVVLNVVIESWNCQVDNSLAMLGHEEIVSCGHISMFVCYMKNNKQNF